MIFENFHLQPKGRELNETQELCAIIRQMIASRGPLPFAEFMALSLYHPQYGYYCRDSFELGKHGDFTTAPELSPLFAASFANQFCEIFKTQLIKKNILELGAGTGRFAKDVLEHLSTLSGLSDHYYIYEISANLRKKQQQFLQQVCPHYYSKIEWLTELPNHFEGIIFANELLDALPFHCFRIENEAIKERLVTTENDQLIWHLGEPITENLTSYVQKLKREYDLPEEYESEINLNLPQWISELAASIERAVVFLVDYGYGQKEYYRPERKEGTLTCFYKHQKNLSPLIFPGLQDITAHVDFTYVIENASENDFQLLGFTTQTGFLLANGLTDLVREMQAKLTASELVNLNQAIKKLTLPSEMGELIKVMALGKNMELSLSGFSMLDRTRDL